MFASTKEKPDSKVHCLAYYSKGTRQYSEEALQNILRKSRYNNSRDGISGILLYVKGSFFQLLEGPSEKVYATFARIAKDRRHHGISVIYDSLIERRHFPQWSMGFPSPNSEMLEKLIGYVDICSAGERDLELLKTHRSGVYATLSSLGQNLGKAVGVNQAPSLEPEKATAF